MTLAFTIVAALLAGIALVHSRGHSLLAWAVVALCIALLWGRV